MSSTTKSSVVTRFDVEWARAQFPALQQTVNGQPVVFFDAPGGTQVPQRVIDAISNYLATSNANTHGAFLTSERTDEVYSAAHAAMADFFNCDPDEVVFGANMTTLTFALSRAIGRELKSGDELLVTQLDHDANVSPWVALEERGAKVRTADIKPADCTLDMFDLQAKVRRNTRLVAVGYAANAVGTINEVAEVVRLAHAVGAMAFIDAVHYAPHGLIDVRALDCDFLVCSSYKFFGPHMGVMYGKREHLQRLRPYKLRACTEQLPDRWESGTQNHEGMAASHRGHRVSCRSWPSPRSRGTHAPRGPSGGLRRHGSVRARTDRATHQRTAGNSGPHLLRHQGPGKVRSAHADGSDPHGRLHSA